MKERFRTIREAAVWTITAAVLAVVLVMVVIVHLVLKGWD